MSNQQARLGLSIPRPVSDRIDAAAQAMSTVMAHVSLGAHGNQFERALSGLRAVQCLTTAAGLPAQPMAGGAVIKWQSGAGLLWDVHAFGRWALRVVSPLNWDAHSVHQALVRAGYAEHIDVTCVHAEYSPAPEAQAGARDALTHAELLEVKRAIAEFDDCNETDVPYALLMRAAHAGYLNCTYFEPADKEALDRDIAAAEQEPANA